MNDASAARTNGAPLIPRHDFELGLAKAIAKFGSARKLAAALGIAAPAITGWKLRGMIPAERARDIERVTGVPLHELRPDLWDAP